METRDKLHGMCVRGSREASTENLISSSFLCKTEISSTHCINLKYNCAQEIRPRPTIPVGISQLEIPRFSTCNQQAN